MHALLVRLRERQGPELTQAEVGRRIGVTRVAVCNWEQGIRMPEPEHLGALLDLYAATDAERAEAWRLRSARRDDAEKDPDQTPGSADPEPAAKVA